MRQQHSEMGAINGLNVNHFFLQNRKLLSKASRDDGDRRPTQFAQMTRRTSSINGKKVAQTKENKQKQGK